jgi:hypothetical protein
MKIHSKVFALLLFSASMLYAQGQAPAAATGGPQAPERLAADTPKTTVMGNTFIAPKDWTLTVKGPATILEAPEGGSWIALVDVAAKDDDEALAKAWKAYRPEAKWDGPAIRSR